MLIQCTQCHKEYLPEAGLRGPSGKPYCSQFCLKQSQTPESDSTSAETDPVAFPLGKMALIILGVCGGLYLLQNALLGSSPESDTVMQESQTEQVQAVATDPIQAPIPVETASASPAAETQPIGPSDAPVAEANQLSSQSASPEQVLQNVEKNMKNDPLAARASLEQLIQTNPSSKAFYLLAQLQMQANEFSPARRSAEQCLNQARTAEDRKSCHELSIQVFQQQVDTGIDEDSSATQRSQTAAQLAQATQNPKSAPSVLPTLAPQLTDRVKLELQQEELRHAQELIALAPKEGKGYWYKATAQCQLADSPDATAQANASLAEACHLGHADACKQRCRDGKMGRS